MVNPIVLLAGGAVAVYAFLNNKKSDLVIQAVPIAKEQVANGMAPVDAAKVATATVLPSTPVPTVQSSSIVSPATGNVQYPYWIVSFVGANGRGFGMTKHTEAEANAYADQVRATGNTTVVIKQINRYEGK